MIFFKNKNQNIISDIQSVYKKLNKNSTCIDCGANIGSITLQMAETGAKVYAFEPNPYAYEQLQKNINQFKNVICFQKGVYIEDTKKELFFHQNSSQDEIYWSTGSSLLDFKGNVDKNKSQLVEIIDLNKFIIQLNSKIDLLKIDVEGVEIEILNKLIDTGVIHKIKYVFVETHEKKIPELLESTNKLRERIKKEKITHINLDWI